MIQRENVVFIASALLVASAMVLASSCGSSSATKPNVDGGAASDATLTDGVAQEEAQVGDARPDGGAPDVGASDAEGGVILAVCSQANGGTLCAFGDGGLGSCCEGACMDFRSDPKNCGGCGEICGCEGVCIAGACYTADGGSEQQCFFGDGGLSADAGCPAGTAEGAPLFSATCRTLACSPSLSGAACISDAGAAGACCGSSCTDVLNDTANCGACGQACAGLCLSGTCVIPPTCSASNGGAAYCDLGDGGTGNCCEGACMRFDDDPNNCGGCGRVCACQGTCVGGQCMVGAVTDRCADCPAGMTSSASGECAVNMCSAALSGAVCVFGPGEFGNCCGETCVRFETDPMNCGACGQVCDGICSVYRCLPKTPAACATPNCDPPAICSGKQCIEASCQTCQGECVVVDAGAIGACCCSGSQPAHCADLSSDPDNCGGCGIRCPASQTCADGVCSGAMPPCGAGREDSYCGLAGGGQGLCCLGQGCIDLAGDNDNCGGCGDKCSGPVMMVGGRWVGGICIDYQCGGVTSCTGQPDGPGCVSSGGVPGQCCGGTCVDVFGTDSNNCGACGQACGTERTCLKGVCGVDSCTGQPQNTGCHTDAGINNDYGSCCSGVCANIAGDPNNCGQCGVVCPAGTDCSAAQCL